MSLKMFRMGLLGVSLVSAIANTATAKANELVFKESFENPAISTIGNSNGNWATIYAGESFLGDSGNTWYVDSGSIDLDVGGWNPYNGVQSIDTNGWTPGSFYTTLNLTPGTYDLSFAFTNGPYIPNAAQLNVTWNGSLVGGSPLVSSNVAVPDNINWTDQLRWQFHVDWSYLTFRILVDTDTNVLKFSSGISAGPHGTLIDDVELLRVASVPEPGAIGLFGIAALGLAHRTRRKWSQK